MQYSYDERCQGRALKHAIRNQYDLAVTQSLELLSTLQIVDLPHGTPLYTQP